MLPLSAETTPTTVPEFTEALRRGLQEQGLTPRNIEARGEALSQLEMLLVDLSETRLTRDFRSRPAEPTGAPTVELAQFELLGAPVYFETAPLTVRLTAAGVKAGMDITGGHGSLVL